MDAHHAVTLAADWIKARLPEGLRPEIAVIAGTGLGGLAEAIEAPLRFAYADIPGFPTSTVEGHAGELVAGTLEGKRVLLQNGRFHLYEGRTPAQVCMGVRTAAALGAGTLVVTNVSGALNPQFAVGGVMVITDHVNLTGQSPLVGPNTDALGPRFPDMSRVYSQRLIDLALRAGLELGQRLERGVYVGVLGPQLETPAETRFLRRAGDAVGMSTVMEVIAAKHLGMEIAGLSCLVNKNLPDCMAEVAIEEILDVAARSAQALTALVRGLVRSM